MTNRWEAPIWDHLDALVDYQWLASPDLFHLPPRDRLRCVSLGRRHFGVPPTRGSCASSSSRTPRIGLALRGSRKARGTPTLLARGAASALPLSGPRSRANRDHSCRRGRTQPLPAAAPPQRALPLSLRCGVLPLGARLSNGRRCTCCPAGTFPSPRSSIAWSCRASRTRATPASSPGLCGDRLRCARTCKRYPCCTALARGSGTISFCVSPRLPGAAQAARTVLADQAAAEAAA